MNRLLLASSVCAGLVGCGGAPLDVAPVHGRVTIGNQPLTQGKVMFAPVAKQGEVDAGKPGVGLIQSDGSYSVSTYADGDGAVVGEHWVTLFVPQSDPRQAGGSPDEVPKFKRLAWPQRVTVASGEDNQIDLRLSQQDLARIGVPQR